MFTHYGRDVVYEEATKPTLFGGTTIIPSSYQNGPGIDNKLSVAESSNTNFFLADHLGSTDALTDGSGAIVDSQTYDSFGNGTNAGFTSRYQFTGREFDAAIGLQFSRARFYDPKLGRFVSEDPIGFEGGDINLYGYVRSNSMNRTDPLGLYDPADWQMAARAIGVAGGAGAAGGGALVAGAAPYIAVGAGGLALGAGIGYYPGQWTANSPYNPFVYGPWNPFGTPYNPFAGPMPQPGPQASSSKPEVACQPATNPQPFYRVPPYSSPFEEPEDDRDRDICGKVLALCLRNPRQPKWNQKQYGKRKDCGACYRECRLNGGAWPFEKCPDQGL